MITARQWIASVPAHLTLYAVLGSVSDAKPVVAYFERTQQVNLTALWQETPYANWFDAMPYIAPLERESPFLDWVDDAPTQDWGWLGASPFDSETIRRQFKGLTKVYMPDDSEVFFRYWDGRYLYPILSYLQARASDVIAVFSHYLINRQPIEVAISHKPPDVNDFPWWRVEQPLMATLIKAEPNNVATQLVELLKQNDPELYRQSPEKNLFIKAQQSIADDAFSLDSAYSDFKRFILGER